MRGPHDTKFYAALHGLTAEYEEAQRLGYWPGAGFLTPGTRLGGADGADVPRNLARVQAAEAALRRQRAGGQPPTRLGGRSATRPLRELAAEVRGQA